MARMCVYRMSEAPSELLYRRQESEGQACLQWTPEDTILEEDTCLLPTTTCRCIIILVSSSSSSSSATHPRGCCLTHHLIVEQPWRLSSRMQLLLRS